MFLETSLHASLPSFHRFASVTSPSPYGRQIAEIFLTFMATEWCLLRRAIYGPPQSGAVRFADVAPRWEVFGSFRTMGSGALHGTCMTALKGYVVPSVGACPANSRFIQQKAH